MNKEEKGLLNGDITFFINYNDEYYNDEYRLSEMRPFNLDIINKWIAIRDDYTYTEDDSGDGWYCIDVTLSHSKYGLNYIFINPEKKLWRTRESASEFYGSRPPMFEFQKGEKMD